MRGGLGEVPVEEHRVAAGHEEGGDEAGVALDGDRGVEVLEVFLLHVAFFGFDAAAQVVERDGFAVDFDAPAEDEAVDFVAFVADEGEGGVGPAVDVRGLVLPFGAAEFEDVVVDVEGEGDVEIVGPDRGVRALGFCRLEVEEADLVPEERADLTLEGCQTVCGAMAQTVDANALRQADESADHD